ncbi:MAG: hypothetical protein ACLS37_12135 [Alistipes sp.]
MSVRWGVMATWSARRWTRQRQQAESGILFNATPVRCMLENGICAVRFETGFPDFEAIEESFEKLQECYDRMAATKPSSSHARTNSEPA